MNKRKNKTNRKAAALLVVLFIVIAITIVSLGIVSRSDVELACGQNMLLRTRLDYLADSGLEHAKGLIMNPQDVDSEYWAGDQRQQLVEGSDDYYNIDVLKKAGEECNYLITCEAFREKGTEKVGRSSLLAELRLDPCIALWTGNNITVSSNVTIKGDVYCNGTLINMGVIDGDVFTDSLDGSINGRKKSVVELPLVWPRVTVADFTSNYPVTTLASSLSNESYGPYSPERVLQRVGDLELAGNVQIDGMVIVEGDLVISGTGNVIRVTKNMPAVLVTGDVIVDSAAELDIEGLAVVEGQFGVSADGADINIVGALFTQEGVFEIAVDSAGGNNALKLNNGPTWQPTGGYIDGAINFDGSDDTIEDCLAEDYLNGLSAVTVSFWLKSDVTNQDKGIAFTREPKNSDEELGIRYDSRGAFGGGSSVIKASIRTGSGYTQIESSSNVQATNWQHLALVWQSGSSLQLYIDGVANVLTYDQGPLAGTTSGVEKLMIGRGTKGAYWDGLIDDVRIYNYALDASQIKPNTMPGGAGLIAHWKLDGQDNSTISMTAAPTKAAVVVWSEEEVAENWSPSADAFYRSIERQ
ncbi:LamG-like jellyroll fold domain-containing protein [Planctomycetota bacterium]